jgi:energy-coupling factor transporter transmembrane protein EcfT
VHFWGLILHPSTALIAWLAAVLAVQFVGYAGLAIMALAVLLSTSVARSWASNVYRARWLLLTLWLILSYNTPGEAMLGAPWAPTYEGIADANLQAMRLVLMLGCLAWLSGRLGRDGLVSALWGVLQPLQVLRVDTRRLVIRLSLVLANLQTPQEKGSWRRMMAADAPLKDGPTIVHVALPRWAASDTLIVVAAAAILIGAIVL